MIKYLGSKRTLLPYILAIVMALPDVRRVCDLCAGTTRVGQGLKEQGLWIHSNDLATYSEIFGRTYIETDARSVDLTHLRRQIDALMALPPMDGYITATFCERARYFQPENGRMIDAIRAGIDQIATNATEQAILLTALIEAADRVDSTVGLQMAYLKAWSARSYHPLALRVPRLIDGTGLVTRMDANATAPHLDCDLVYLDPPYNQHSYYGNYHIWETLVRNDAPATYGTAMKRLDRKTTQSAYNSRIRALATLTDLIANIRAPYILASISDEGIVTPRQLADLLAQRGYVAARTVPNRRHVGAQIGIHNPDGEKVGTPGKKTNREYLLLCGPDRAVVERATDTSEGNAEDDWEQTAYHERTPPRAAVHAPFGEEWDNMPF